MARFVLVHGAWHGAWCWDLLAKALVGAGHEVLAPDLPGHGPEGGPWWRATLGAYAQTVSTAGQTLGKDVIAVGHSLGGLVITEAAARSPGIFGALVYLCAFVPLPGENLLSLARADTEGGVPGAVSRGLFTTAFHSDRASAVFYNRCAEDIAHASAARLCPEPNLPTVQRVSQPRAAWPPRAYIECLQDRAISPDYQRGMHRRAGVPRVLSLDADHSPFLSAPTELADMLGMLAGELVKPGTGEESSS